MGSGPPCKGSEPLTAGSQGPRRGSGTDTCQDPIWCGPVRIRLCSPPRQRPDATTWPTAHDVSQRAEPDVRLPGYAASAFIADKARRLTSDVPPRHLMRPAHFAIRRRPVHSTGKQCAASAFNEICPFRWQATCLSIPLAGGMPVYSIGRRHAHAAACAILIITRMYQGSYRCVSTLRGQRTSGRQKISQASPALVAPCISSIMSLGPHVVAQQPCMCLPWAIKRKAHDVTRHAHLDATQALKLIDSHTQYNP
jgi:hypothetical protein